MTKSSKGQKKPVEKKPWKGRCNGRCWNSRSQRCRCKCKGQYHGAGHYGRKTEINEWVYETDEKTGLQILKTEKDPRALEKIRKMGEELFGARAEKDL